MSSKKNILIVTHFFPPETGAASIRMKYFVEALNTGNYNVKVVAPNPSYGITDGYKPTSDKKQDSWFVQKYLYIFIPSKDSVITRFFSYISFFISILFHLSFDSFKPDIIISSTPPLFTPMASLIISKFRNAKFILDIRDIWPDIGIELGILKNKSMIRGLKFIESFILRNSDEIIVTAIGDKENLIRKSIDLDKISVIYNGADTEKIRIITDLERELIYRKYNLSPNKQVIIYFGWFNLGMNDIDLLIDSLLQISNVKEKFHFISVGSGSQREEAIGRLDGKIDFSIIDSLSIEEIAELLPICSISLIPRKFISSDTGGNIPVKCFESWAAGIPVVISTIDGTEIGQIFNRCKFGKITNAGNVNEYSSAIVDLLDNSPSMERKHDARTFVVENFDRKKQSQNLLKIVEKVL